MYKAGGKYSDYDASSDYPPAPLVFDHGHMSGTSYAESPPSVKQEESIVTGESVLIENILNEPGRNHRPKQIVIILRGLPGSGKTYVSKLIKVREAKMSSSNPRMLCLDDYFMTEVDKSERDPETGKQIRKKVLEYEYESEMEDAYRASLFKAFKKTIEDGFFDFIIVDAINEKVKHFEQFWTFAKQKAFEVYIAEMSSDISCCVKKNIHHRTQSEIKKIHDAWESTPVHYNKLDVRSLLQDDAIAEVEMEDLDEDDDAKKEEEEEEKTKPSEEEKEGHSVTVVKSKWEDASEGKLDKLDGVMSYGKRKREDSASQKIEDYLQLSDDYANRASQPGKKRVCLCNYGVDHVSNIVELIRNDML
ncbi:YLP motif-containing protein 1-like [Saccoglossus kowalevskii]